MFACIFTPKNGIPLQLREFIINLYCRPVRGSTVRKIDSTRNIRASQATIEKREIASMEQKIKDLSFESTNSKGESFVGNL